MPLGWLISVLLHLKKFLQRGLVCRNNYQSCAPVSAARPMTVPGQWHVSMFKTVVFMGRLSYVAKKKLQSGYWGGQIPFSYKGMSALQVFWVCTLQLDGGVYLGNVIVAFSNSMLFLFLDETLTKG